MLLNSIAVCFSRAPAICLCCAVHGVRSTLALILIADVACCLAVTDCRAFLLLPLAADGILLPQDIPNTTRQGICWCLSLCLRSLNWGERS